MQNVFTRVVEGSQCKSLHTIRCKTPSAISLPLYTHSVESTRPAARVKTTRKYSSLVLSVVCCLIVEVSCWLVSEYREYHHNHRHHRSLHHHYHCHHHHRHHHHHQTPVSVFKVLIFANYLSNCNCTIFYSLTPLKIK